MPNDKTPNLQLPYLYQTQSQKEVTVNLSLTTLDAILNNGAVSQAVATPPGSPTDNVLYIIPASPTGAWSGKAGQVTYYNNGWKFIEPNEGFTLWVNDEDKLYIYNGTAWVSDVPTGFPLLGINATADSTNKLAVGSSAVLFDNIGAGVQAKINKHASSDTNSFLFQTNYSGRAEMGCAGDDNFHFKVSPNGSSWVDAMQVDKTTGDVTLAALTASKALVTDSAKKLTSSATTSTEIGYVSGVTSAIQTQLNNKVSTSLTSAHLLVGNSSNVATDTAITGDVTISNAGVTAIGSGKVTNAMLAGGVDLTSKVTGILPAANGGTGVNNSGKSITLGGNLTTSGANAVTFTTSGATNVTLPTSGTLSTTTGTVTSVATSGLATGGTITGTGTVTVTAATQADMESASSSTTAVTPSVVKYHPGVAKAWCCFNFVSGTPTILQSYNVSSLTDTGSGDTLANLTTAFSGSAAVTGSTDDFNIYYTYTNLNSTSSIRVRTLNSSRTVTDSVAQVNIFGFGDQ